MDIDRKKEEAIVRELGEIVVSVFTTSIANIVQDVGGQLVWELYSRGWRQIAPYKAEILKLTAKADALQSERDNLMRTVEESPTVIAEAKHEIVKTVLQDIDYLAARCGLDEFRAVELRKYAKQHGVEVDE